MSYIVNSAKKRPINIIFMLVVLILYIFNNGFFKTHTTGIWYEFFVCYFNDLLCPLFFLAYCNLLLITSGRELHKLKDILLLIIICGFVWEFIGPLLKKSAVTDYGDLICYLIGAILYWKILRIIRVNDDKNKRNI